MKRQILELQADQIEMVLAHYNVRARVTGGILAPRWVRFDVLPALGTKLGHVKGLAEELALSLNVDACRVSRNRGKVAVEIPRANPKPVRLLPMQRRLMEGDKGIPHGTAVLGLAEDGAPLLVRLPSPSVAHLLIAGTTGSGKSALMQTIIASMALSHRPGQLSFVLIDPKRRAFGPLAGLPHLLRPVMSEPERVTGVLQSLVQLMLDRDNKGESEPRVVVVIDELADLLMMAGEAQRPLVRLAQRGREAGIHLVVGTQKPTTEIVGSLGKANFPVRLVGQVTSPEEAKVATGYAGTGAEKLRGPGDFIAVTRGQVTRFQGAFVSTVELVEVVRELTRRNGGGRAVVTLPTLRDEPATPEDAQLSEYVELARPSWLEYRDGEGGLERGGIIAIARAIFGEKAHGAGTQYHCVKRVVSALEENGAHKTSQRTLEGCENNNNTAPPLLLRPKSGGKARQRVLLGFSEGKFHLG